MALGQTHTQPVNLIFDTDMSADCDDTAALAMLHGMAHIGEAHVLAVMVSSTDEYSSRCADAINTHYRRPETPDGEADGNVASVTVPARDDNGLRLLHLTREHGAVRPGLEQYLIVVRLPQGLTGSTSR